MSDKKYASKQDRVAAQVLREQVSGPHTDEVDDFFGLADLPGHFAIGDYLSHYGGTGPIEDILDDGPDEVDWRQDFADYYDPHDYGISAYG